jgi:hypothetical protein
VAGVAVCGAGGGLRYHSLFVLVVINISSKVRKEKNIQGTRLGDASASQADVSRVHYPLPSFLSFPPVVSLPPASASCYPSRRSTFFTHVHVWW